MLGLLENLIKSLMTNYQILIDTITNEMYQLYTTTDNWDEIQAAKVSHKILELVEKFQQRREI
jgi:hypothetical protein